MYEKTKGKASVRQRLDSHLNSLGVQMSISFGTKQLNFEFLAHGVDYLVKVRGCGALLVQFDVSIIPCSSHYWRTQS